MNNSFRIEFRGPRPDLEKSITAITAPPKGSDQSQCDAAKAAVLASAKALDGKFDGVNVLSYGDLGKSGGEFRVQVSGYLLRPANPQDAPPIKPKA